MAKAQDLADYRLPDGTVVQVDDTAAKGSVVIDYTLKGGEIVQAVRVEGLMGALRRALPNWEADHVEG